MDDAVCGYVDLHRVIDRMPPHLVVVMWLLAQGWTRREIADAFDVSQQAVSTWFQELKTGLQRHGEGWEAR